MTGQRLADRLPAGEIPNKGVKYKPHRDKVCAVKITLLAYSFRLE